MAPLPRPFSREAATITSAILEGRAEEAMQKLIAALRAEKDNKAARLLAADWIESLGLKPGDAKKLRNGQPTLPNEWLDVAEMVMRLQDEGLIRAEADRRTAEYFGYSQRHIENCVARWHEANEASRKHK